MAEFGSGFRRSKNDRRVGIVSGKKSFSSVRARSQQPVPDRATRFGYSSSSNSSSSSSAAAAASNPWRSFSDPETKRRKRIAKYKIYTVEGKVKASFRNGFRWFKNKCSQIVKF